MIDTLVGARDDHLSRPSNEGFTDNFSDIPDSILRRVEMKLCPEKVALSPAELELLMENDVLSKITAEEAMDEPSNNSST